jgi:hypothetical protein
MHQELWTCNCNNLVSSLGCKFRQNSGRNFDSIPDSGFFGAGMLRLRFCRSASFWMTHFHTSAVLNTPPPHCKAGLIWLRRNTVSFFSLHTSKWSWYQESFSWVAFKLKKNRPELRPLRRIFGSHSGFWPISDRNRNQNLHPSFQPLAQAVYAQQPAWLLCTLETVSLLELVFQEITQQLI